MPLDDDCLPANRPACAVHVLALNSGSSSLKFGLYRVLDGVVEVLFADRWASLPGDAANAVASIRTRLNAQGLPLPSVIGHRVVHGGPQLRDHAHIDATVLRQLSSAEAFAPLHTRAMLALVQQATQHYPGVPQVACLDTAFHAHKPEEATVLPLPAALRARGLQRYGFHGLSCASIVRALSGELPRRLIIAHLGSGASVTAVLDGRCVDTSMGLTPSGGLLMGCRMGDVDPGLLVYLARELQFDAAQLEALVDHGSGMLALSGLSGDLRVLRAAVLAGGPASAGAALAIQVWTVSLRKQLAAMAVMLGGVDRIVLTGGIGENDAALRADLVHGLSGIGLRPDSLCRDGGVLRVMATQEESQIAIHAAAMGAPSGLCQPPSPAIR